MIQLLLSASAVAITYAAWNYFKELPFSYITQTEIPMCRGTQGFCVRLSYVITAMLVYLSYVNITGVKNAFKTGKSTGLEGAAVGASLSAFTTIINILFGFIRITGVDISKLSQLPGIIVGMFFTGLTEEIMYRALPINALAPYIGNDAIVWLSSLVFGYVHSGYSLVYGFTAFVTGLLLGYGFIKNNIWWVIGLHSAFNTVETGFYTVAKYTVKNTTMAGERKTPDDDGLTSSLVTVFFLILQYMNYI